MGSFTYAVQVSRFVYIYHGWLADLLFLLIYRAAGLCFQLLKPRLLLSLTYFLKDSQVYKLFFKNSATGLGRNALARHPFPTL